MIKQVHKSHLTLLCAFTIFVIGLLMIFNTTSAEVLDHGLSQSTHAGLMKQLVFGCIAFGLGYYAWRVGYKSILQWSGPLLLFFTFLLFLVFVPGIGKTVNGAKRWISIAGFSFQPSEFVKIILPAYVIHTLISTETLTFRAFMFLIAKVSVPLFLTLIEPNNGTVAVMGITLVVVFFLTNVPFKFWALPLICFLVVGSVSALSLPYVRARLQVYWNPELDLRGRGHQPHQAKIAAGSGKLYGKGPGNSMQKLSYLPEAQNDYIAAIYAEEFGFLGIALLIVLYTMLTYLGFDIAYHARNPGACCLSVVITFLISFQAFLNLGVVSGLLPSTGLNLPLFSQGGTSLVANCFGIGILLSGTRHEA